MWLFLHIKPNFTQSFAVRRYAIVTGTNAHMYIVLTDDGIRCRSRTENCIFILLNMHMTLRSPQMKTIRCPRMCVCSVLCMWQWWRVHTQRELIMQIIWYTVGRAWTRSPHRPHYTNKYIPLTRSVMPLWLWHLKNREGVPIHCGMAKWMVAFQFNAWHDACARPLKNKKKIKLKIICTLWSWLGR